MSGEIPGEGGVGGKGCEGWFLYDSWSVILSKDSEIIRKDTLNAVVGVSYGVSALVYIVAPPLTVMSTSDLAVVPSDAFPAWKLPVPPLSGLEDIRVQVSGASSWL